MLESFRDIIAEPRERLPVEYIRVTNYRGRLDMQISISRSTPLPCYTMRAFRKRWRRNLFSLADFRHFENKKGEDRTNASFNNKQAIFLSCAEYAFGEA